MMKPKKNYKPGPMDNCQTPPYALNPLLKYLSRSQTIWEPAMGEGILARALHQKGFQVVASDIQNEQDFFEYHTRWKFPQENEYGDCCWDVIVTNPPYSGKAEWIQRCYELGKPFALLLPVETLGVKKTSRWFSVYGIQVLFMIPRIDFKMPNKGWLGGGSQFPTAWFTWGLISTERRESKMRFITLNKTPKKQLVEWEREGKL
jgi:hypothetical protein